MIKIMLVDDHRLVRAGPKRVLAEIADMEVVAEASTGEEALELARGNAPEVVLMDINMPEEGERGHEHHELQRHDLGGHAGVVQEGVGELGPEDRGGVEGARQVLGHEPDGGVRAVRDARGEWYVAQVFGRR